MELIKIKKCNGIGTQLVCGKSIDFSGIEIKNNRKDPILIEYSEVKWHEVRKKNECVVCGKDISTQAKVCKGCYTDLRDLAHNFVRDIIKNAEGRSQNGINNDKRNKRSS